MSKEHYSTEDIERYLEGQMDTKEARLFQAAIDQDHELQSEVEAFNKLIHGLRLYGSETFRNKIVDWENDWQASATDDGELIEWYLSEQLGKGKAIVEDRIQKDKTFAMDVDKQRQLNAGFEAMSSEKFAEQMDSWEHNTEEEAIIKPLKTKASPLFTIRSIAAAIIFLVVAGGIIYWYANANYGQIALTSNLYHAPKPENIMGEGTESISDLSKSLEYSASLLEQGHYDEAFLSFDQLLSQVQQQESLDDFNRIYFTESAEWYRLLAAQATNTPPMELESEVKRIASSTGHSHQEEAIALQHKMQSFWYWLVN